MKRLVPLIAISTSALLVSGVAKPKCENSKPRRVYAVGKNLQSQLGIGNDVHQYTFQNVSFFSDKRVKQIFAGGHMSAAVTEDGEFYTWGNGKDFALGHNDDNNESLPRMVELQQPIVDASVGIVHMMLVTAKRSLITFGNNFTGRLGVDDIHSLRQPSPVAAASTIGNVKQVVCTNDFTLILTSDGSLFQVGTRQSGRPGHTVSNSKEERKKAAQLRVDLDKGDAIVGISGGYAHAFVWTAKGKAYGFGYNENGQLGLGKATALEETSLTPVSTLRHKNIVSIVCGHFHSLFICDNGDCYAAGMNANGQLGNGTNVDATIPAPIALKAAVVAGAAGKSHSVLLGLDGSLYVFGKGLGGDPSDKRTPFKLDSASFLVDAKGEKIVSVASGTDHVLILTEAL